MMAYVRYMDRSRDYYAAQGYERAYNWAHYENVPFSRLTKPLDKARVTLVTTAMPDASFTRNSRRLQICDMSTPPESLYTGELFWDADATHTEDLDSFFPIHRLIEAVADGRLGSLSNHYFCVPTNYSQRETIVQDAPAIVAQCIKDEVDVAILIPL